MPETNATGGWPDMSMPAVPLNADRHGWHWLRLNAGGESLLFEWRNTSGNHKERRWFFEGRHELEPFLVGGMTAEYLGPCLAPTQHAAAVEAARREEREACALIADDQLWRTEMPIRRAKEDGHTSEVTHQEGRWHAANDIQEAIRQRTPKGCL